jgi:lysophospholipase L1-like esterase
MRRILSLALVLAALAVPAVYSQPSPLLPAKAESELFQRSLQLIESTSAAVPGLAHAAAPVLENARQAVLNLENGTPGNATLIYEVLINVRAYLSLADSLPKPYPFPDEAHKQFEELRDAAGRMEAHFRATIDRNQRQLRSPDRDNLRRYADADAKLAKPLPDQKRIVFLGDSITDGWRLNEYFPGRDFVNRGISGQITGEMLGRMKADVIDIKPAAMLVLAGTNDIARGIPLATIENNLTMIADLADAYRIKPIFASVLPISDYHKDVNPRYEMSKLRPPSAIIELNRWLEAFCKQRRYAYVDYFSQMVDPAGYLKADLAADGLHPNSEGYRVMGPLAVAAIDRTIVTHAPPPTPAPAPVTSSSKKRVVTKVREPKPAAEPVQTVQAPAPAPAAVPAAVVSKPAPAKPAPVKPADTKPAAVQASAPAPKPKPAATAATDTSAAKPKSDKVPFWKRTYPDKPTPTPAPK